MFQSVKTKLSPSFLFFSFFRYFMEESILKAISLDTFDAGQLCSSVVDDVFFIVRKTIRRAIETQSIDGICAVINNAASSLEEDFVGALKVPLKSGYPSGFIDLAQAYNAFQTSFQQGKLQTNNDNEQARANFIVQLNNTDMSTEFIETLTAGISEEIRNAFPKIKTKESEILESCLAGMKSVRDTLKAVVDYGLQQLRTSAIKPRLHTWIDQFISLNHTMTDVSHPKPINQCVIVRNINKQFVPFFLGRIERIRSRRNIRSIVNRATRHTVEFIQKYYERAQLRCIGQCTGDRCYGAS